MKMLVRSIFLFVLAFSSAVMASELTAPKNAGIIGERFDGYLGIVKDATPEIRALVEDVNAKRKEHYKAIAVKNKQSLKDVEMIAGETAFSKTDSGNYIFTKDKGWVKK